MLITRKYYGDTQVIPDVEINARHLTAGGELEGAAGALVPVDEVQVLFQVVHVALVSAVLGQERAVVVV